MAKRSTLDDDLAAIRAIKGEPRAPAAMDLLRRVLAGNRSFAVAAAADVVAQAELVELAPLLPAAERAARANAARAIGAAGRADGIPLLRFKCLVGDEDVQVTTECFGALLSLAPSGSLDFVAGFLHSSDDRDPRRD